MAQTIEDLPVYDPVTKRGDFLNEHWIGNLTLLIQSLQGYLNPLGMFIPEVTTAQRNEIQSPEQGQWIFNTTINAPQFYQLSSATWKTVTFS